MRSGVIGRSGPVVAIAHRGDWRTSRENTLPAVAGAVRARAGLVEIDVKVGADGEVVLLHDRTLERLWGDPRPVDELSFPELARLGDGLHQIPTLDTALALVGGTGTGLLIDLDDERWSEPSWAVVDRAVDDRVITREEIAWCGRIDALQRIRDLDPAARIVLSWDESDGVDGAGFGTLPPDEALDSLRPEAVNPHWPMIDEASLRWAAERELPLCCWTVDREPEMRRLLQAGVRAMITNEIRVLQGVLGG